jgi:phage shock protein A
MNVAEAQVMINLIASLSRKSSTYVADVENALKQYKELPSALKKQISNYDVLKQAEKDIKAAQKVMKQIEELDATARSYESRVKSAVKAYEKLTEEQKQLVANYNLLQNAVSELGLEI